ncbi:MAG: hypothetical protein DRJ42_10890 [Deltaproteobacteria bacterium]|nr:MAG: hypothetical protein DRJ42_10890 [Deltaproteobacteria bacterium]
MRFFDIGQEASGFIAIGQEAVGFIAIGQLAVGFIAIGQLARGVFVVGQLAIGVVAVGQLAVGVWGGVGMVTIAGRWVKGIGVAIWPRPDGPKLPKAISLEEVRAGQPGFVRLKVQPATNEVGGSGLLLTYQGEPLEAEVGAAASSSLRDLLAEDNARVLVRLEQKQKMEPSESAGYREAAPVSDYLEASKVVPLPPPPWTLPGFWWKTGARSAATLLVVAVWAAVVTAPFYDYLFTTTKPFP